jgi:hypothetical protein
VSAAELPSFETHSTETPTQPTRAKGSGSATIGSTPAVQNADRRLAHLGGHIDLPCTPERVWQTINAARNGTLPDPWRSCRRVRPVEAGGLPPAAQGTDDERRDRQRNLRGQSGRSHDFRGPSPEIVTQTDF